MRRLALTPCLLCALTACNVPVEEMDLRQREAQRVSAPKDAGADADAGAAGSDAGVDAGVAAVDAGVDAGAPLTWERDARPIFMAHCTRCHVAHNGGLPSFADTYGDLLGSSAVCPGSTVGQCVGKVLAVQGMEGSWCRTWEADAFHRANFPCVAAGDITTVQQWLATGMRER